MTPKDIVTAYWTAMETNNFASAAEWLADSFECEWPQSGEIIRGRENFININANYPNQGKWTFKVRSMICDGGQVVSEVEVSDEREQRAVAVTFHWVKDGKIKKQREFWPESFPAPKWRRQWVMTNSENTKYG